MVKVEPRNKKKRLNFPATLCGQIGKQISGLIFFAPHRSLHGAMQLPGIVWKNDRELQPVWTKNAKLHQTVLRLVCF